MGSHKRQYRTNPAAWIVWLGFTVGLTGCDRLADLANQPGLSADLTELFRRSDISEDSLRCEMISGKRSAKAEVSISQSALSRLIQDVGLSEYQPTGDKRRLPWQLPQSADNCPLVRSWVNDVRGVRLYSIADRPQTLRLNSGRNFEYMFLFRRESTGESRIFVCYAYG